jgi:hypothetical protein
VSRAHRRVNMDDRRRARPGTPAHARGTPAHARARPGTIEFRRVTYYQQTHSRHRTHRNQHTVCACASHVRAIPPIDSRRAPRATRRKPANTGAAPRTQCRQLHGRRVYMQSPLDKHTRWRCRSQRHAAGTWQHMAGSWCINSLSGAACDILVAVAVHFEGSHLYLFHPTRPVSLAVTKMRCSSGVEPAE